MGNPIRLIDPTGKSPNPPDWYENEYGEVKYWDGITQDEFSMGHAIMYDGGGELIDSYEVHWKRINNMGPTNDAYFADSDFGQNITEGNFENSKRLLDVGGGVFEALEKTVRPNQGLWLGKNGKYNDMSWGGNGHTGGRSGAIKAANNYKWGARSTLAATMIIGGAEIYDGYQADGEQFGYNAQSATAQTVGGIGGGIAGATLGAEIGAGIGVWFGGFGAIPLGIIGGFVGGLIGGEVGGSIGQSAVDLYHEK